MNILVLNAGSSSLKFRVFRIDALRPLSEPEDVLAGGHVEGIGKPDAQMVFFHGLKGASERRESIGAESVAGAAQEILLRLAKPFAHGKQPIRIDAIGHRIVHGGARYTEPVVINDHVLHHIRGLSSLAPLHNPLGVSAIEAVRNTLPHTCNVAVFDTSFHHNLPAIASCYALPAALCERLALRRYGFHGVSYRYISDRLKLILEDDEHIDSSQARVIVCHLGSGASVCAMRNGQSIDTSMGFTPLDGLIMSTRSGDIDPGLLLYLLRAEHMTPIQLDEVLNHLSGLIGLSGKSGDLREIEKAASEGHQASKFAMECFSYRVCKYIGAYAAALGGVDSLVFTGGIGEHSASMRSRICHRLSFLGLDIDETRNQAATGQEPVAIGAGQVQKVWIVPTEEERQIAREVFTLTYR